MAAGRDHLPSREQELENQVQFSLDMLQDLLEFLGDAWAQIEELQAEVTRLKFGSDYVARHVDGKPVAPAGILVIDSSRVLQVRFASILQSLGYEVISNANTAAQGLELTASLVPRVVILDSKMKDVRSLTCLKRLLAQNPELKVLICASDYTEGLEKEFKAAGAVAVLAKPIQLDKFVRATKKAMGDIPDIGKIVDRW